MDTAVASATLADEVLAVRELRKVYGQAPVVDGLSFAIRRGECYALLGPNGAGKTTTLRCCLGLTRPDGGTIRLVGEPVPREARRARIRVGVVPQMDNLDPDFTVAENLIVYGRYYGLKDSEVAQRLPSLLEFASLSHKARRQDRRTLGRHEAPADAGTGAGQRSGPRLHG